MMILFSKCSDKIAGLFSIDNVELILYKSRLPLLRNVILTALNVSVLIHVELRVDLILGTSTDSRLYIIYTLKKKILNKKKCLNT